MNRAKFLLSTTGALLFAACLYCPVFHAMPKFMERYDADQYAKAEMKGKCSTCHITEEGYGPVNSFGKMFAANGYVINDGLRKQAGDYFSLGTGSAKPAVAAFDAKAFYSKNCAGCHGNDGAGGDGILGLPNFKDTKWQQRHTDQQFIDAIAKGKGTMPPWKDKLNEGQIKALANYVRQLAE